jgi:putative FmdB family regulatory protein
MPTYQYRCTECGRDLEVVQKFTDEALTQCPQCSGKLRKVFNAVGVVFKGPGFYATDSRSSNRASGKSTAAIPAKTDSSSTSATPKKSDAAPSTGSTSAA